MVTVERLRELLAYDPETGVFTWRMRPSVRSRAKPGDRAGRSRTKGARYSQIQLEGQQMLAHRLAWLYMTGAWPSLEIDHINGDGFDNRWANLRLASRAENMQNLHKAQTESGRVGVHWSRGAWSVRIKVNGHGRYIGRFQDLNAALEAHAEAKRLYHTFQSEPRA